jgi:hypothetical protein
LNRVKQESEGIIPTLDLLEEKVEADGRLNMVSLLTYDLINLQLKRRKFSCSLIRSNLFSNPQNLSPKEIVV